jgi:hypothetical protein
MNRLALGFILAVAAAIAACSSRHDVTAPTRAEDNQGIAPHVDP